MKTPTSTASLDNEPSTGIPPHKQPAQKQLLMKNEGDKESERARRKASSEQKEQNKQKVQEMERRESFESV